jgi:hypothetical protein
MPLRSGVRIQTPADGEKQMKLIKHGFAAAALAAFGAPAFAADFNPADPAQDNFVQGNFLFLAYHEAGHMMLDLALKVDQHAERRRAEEASDDLATWLMRPDPDEPEQDEQVFAAVEGWRRSAIEAEPEIDSNPHYPSDDDRADRIECLIYGGNPNLYAEIAEAFQNPGDAQACIDEHASLEEEFAEWFGEALIDDSESPGASIHYAYEPVGLRQNLAAAADYMADNQMLEDFAEDVAHFIELPEDVYIIAKSCGAGQAQFKYNSAARQIILCYEAVDWFMKRAALGPHGVPPSDDEASGTEGGDDDLGSGGGRVKKKPVKR